MAADSLLIDISNSFTKVVPSQREALSGPVARFRTRDLTASALAHQVGPAHQYRAIILSSVVPTAVEAIREYAGETPLLQINHETPLGIGIDYPSPASIGADRLANAAGAAALYGAPAIVVDFGTAVTFDVLSGPENPHYLGGVIAPGLEAMTHYLHQRTALLPEIDLSEPTRAIGKSTREAMLAGAIYGYRGLVRAILEEIERELPAEQAPKIVATGGYAELIAERLPEITEVHPTLTLEGLRMIANYNFPL